MRLLGLGLVFVVGLGACNAWAIGGGTDESLSEEELAFAQAIVHDEASVEGAVISRATAPVRRGTVTDGNVGPPCTSGRLLQVKLVGRFPHIVTTGHPLGPGGQKDLVITADAETGQICLNGVQTSDVEPEPGAKDIPLD